MSIEADTNTHLIDDMSQTHTSIIASNETNDGEVNSLLGCFLELTERLERLVLRGNQCNKKSPSPLSFGWS